MKDRRSDSKIYTIKASKDKACGGTSIDLPLSHCIVYRVFTATTAGMECVTPSNEHGRGPHPRTLRCVVV